MKSYSHVSVGKICAASPTITVALSDIFAAAKLSLASNAKSAFTSSVVKCAVGQLFSIVMPETPIAVPISRNFLGFAILTHTFKNASVSSEETGIPLSNALFLMRKTCSQKSKRLSAYVLDSLSGTEVSLCAYSYAVELILFLSIRVRKLMCL